MGRKVACRDKSSITLTLGIEPFEALANAIILQGVDDYQAALTARARHFPTSKETLAMLDDCDQFFCGKWIDELSACDGKWLRCLTTVDGEYLKQQSKKAWLAEILPTLIKHRTINFNEKRVGRKKYHCWHSYRLEDWRCENET